MMPSPTHRGKCHVSIDVLRNQSTDRWHGNENDLIEHADEQAARWRKACDEGDTEIANAFVGEVVGLIRSIEPARKILEGIVAEAEVLIRSEARKITA